MYAYRKLQTKGWIIKHFQRKWSHIDCAHIGKKLRRKEDNNGPENQGQWDYSEKAPETRRVEKLCDVMGYFIGHCFPVSWKDT